MSLKRLIQQSRNGNGVGYCMHSTYSPWSEPVSSPPLDNSRTREFTNSVDSLTKEYKQLALRRMSSLGDSSSPQRKSLTILKEDNETFGFEIQILPFQRQSNNSFEMYSYVCKVKEGSPAFLSGLKSGYILTSINGVSTESLCHKKMVDLINASGNLLRLVVVNEALIVKRMELETKLRFLKKTLQEKLVEFQSLCFREQRLANGEVELPLDSIGSDSSNLFGDYVGSGSAMTSKARFSSESSCLSRLSSMTVDSEDSFYQACVFEDAARGTFSRQSSTEDDCFLPRDSDIAHMKTSLRRHRSFRMSSSESMSPSSDGGKVPNIFGTLPRKNRSGSIRKRLLNFIPGLHRAVEEEEIYF